MTKQIFSENFSETPLWWEDAAPVETSSADPSGEVDVVVVGSGYAGLSCALDLARGGATVTVIDAGKCGIGASTRNAGFLSGRAGVSKQIDLQAAVGAERAGQILEEADDAFENLKTLVASEDIQCNLDHVGRFVGAHTPNAYDTLSKKMAEYNSNSNSKDQFYMVTKQDQGKYVDSDYWHGGMFVSNAGTIHPSRYHQGLVRLCLDAGVKLVTESRVIGIVREGDIKQVATVNGTYTAREVVLATNGYTDSLSPWHQKRLIPISSTIVASAELGEQRVNAMLPHQCPVIDTKRMVCFARPSPDRKRILFGGRARFSPLTAEQSAEILHQQLTTMFPQMADIKVTNVWSGHMAFTFDFLPKIGIHDDVHYAIGCNAGCGIVMMSWLGKQVAGKILGSRERASAFEGLPFKTQMFYAGKPWFLPFIGNWWRVRDWAELQQARFTAQA